MPATRVFAVLMPVVYLVGCASNDEGFTLPAGDAERGHAAFVTFRCFDCHQVHNVDLPAGEQPDQVVVKLGGEVTRAKTYSDLVTGIINPSHRLATGYAEAAVSDD